MDATPDEMLADYYAHLFHDDPKELEAVEDDDFDPDSVAEQIGMGGSSLPLPDDWEDMK